MSQIGGLLGADASSTEIDTLVKNVKMLQEQVALLDRVQNIRLVEAWVWALVGLGAGEGGC
jgi:hypothetical protein